jgi:O-antigen/teichoic acid export membrane protein
MFAILGGASFVFYTNIDKILIYKYLTVADVGIYKAYYMSSINFARLLFGIFNTVFFPTASKYKNKYIIFKRINTIVPYIIIIGLPFTLTSQFIILTLYGSGYQFDLILMILFGLAAIIIFLNSCYVWLMASVGIDGIKITSLGAIITAVMNIVLNIMFIPVIGLRGAIIATIISYIVFTLIIFLKRSLLQNKMRIRGVRSD